MSATSFANPTRPRGTLGISLSTLDASLILQYSVGLIDDFPSSSSTQYNGSGNLTMIDQGINPGMVIEIPIFIDNGLNIYGFKGGVNFNADILAFDTLIFSNQFSNYFLEYNANSIGTVKIASAGGKVDINHGHFATIVFEVSEEFNYETEVSLIDWEWNDGYLVSQPVSMNITYGLGIENDLIPKTFALHQNYPNPFNPVTQIRYDLPKPSFVEINIYDLMGRVVRNFISSSKNLGYHTEIWNATNNSGEPVSAGVYIYTIRAGDFKQTKKMLLLK